MTRVGCFHCGWTGRKAPRECRCNDYPPNYCCCRWGTCPACDGRLATVDDLLELVGEGRDR